MADTNNLSDFLTDVANAIKEKKGTTDKIPAANFDTEIKSIKSGTAHQNARVFKTVEEMNNFSVEHYDELEEGDYAAIYGETDNRGVPSGGPFTSLYLPEEITLDRQVTDTISYSFKSHYGNGGGNGTCTITATGFDINIHLNMSYCFINYESTDGITYTRTSVEPSNMGWGSSVKFVWNAETSLLTMDGADDDTYFYYEDTSGDEDILSKIYVQPVVLYNGLYQTVTKQTKNAPKVSQYLQNILDNSTVEPKRAYIGMSLTYSTTDLIGITTGTKNYKGEECETFDKLYQSNYSLQILNYDGKVRFGTWQSYTTTKGTGTFNITRVIYDITNSTNEKETLTFDLASQPYKYVNGTSTYAFCEFFSTDDIEHCRVLQMASSCYVRTALSSTSTTVSRNSAYNYYLDELVYDVAKTQFTLTSANQLLPGVVAGGKSGEVIGDSTIYDNLNSVLVTQKIIGVDTSKTNGVIGGIPTKYTSSLGKNMTTAYGKKCSLNEATDVVRQHTYNTVSRTKLYKYIERYTYDDIYGMMFSIQEDYTINDSGVRADETEYLVVEDMKTHEILLNHQINYHEYKSGKVNYNSYLYNCDDWICILETTIDSEANTVKNLITAYSKKDITSTPITIHSSNRTYSSSDKYSITVKCKRNLVFYNEAYTTGSGTSSAKSYRYWVIYNLDNSSSTVLTNTYTSSLGTINNNVGITSYVDVDYVYVGYCYSTKNYYPDSAVYKVNLTNGTYSTIGNFSQDAFANDTVLPKEMYNITTHTINSDKTWNLSTLKTQGQPYAYVYNEEGNELAKHAIGGKLITIDGEFYVCTGKNYDTAYKVVSITPPSEGQYYNIVVDISSKLYIGPTTSDTYLLGRTSVTSIPWSSNYIVYNVKDDYFTGMYISDNGTAITTINALCIPVKETDVLDYDYSVYRNTKSCWIESPAKLDDKIDYDTSLSLSEKILNGGEE